MGEWGDDVNKPVNPGFDGEIFLKGHLGIEGFALRLGVSIEFSGDLVDIDTDVFYLSAEPSELLHEIVEGNISGEDPDGLIVEDGTNKAAHIVLWILIQEMLELAVSGVADFGGKYMG